jgi:hypothetical protein
MRDATKCDRMREIQYYVVPPSVLFGIQIFVAGAKQLRSMKAVGRTVFRLHRFEDAALLTDG